MTKNNSFNELVIEYSNKLITNTCNVKKFLGIMIDNTLSWKSHRDKTVPILSQGCYISRVVKLFLTHDVLKMIYNVYFHSVMTYGLFFCGNSSHNITSKRLQNKIIRIMMGARSRDFCRDFFKILGILVLPLTALYIYSITMCSLSVIESTSWKILNDIISYHIIYFRGSVQDDVKTRNNNLFHLQSNLSVYQRGPHYACIKIYNNVPIQIKLLSSNFNQFKKVLKDFLQLHSFYTLAEYINYNRD